MVFRTTVGCVVAGGSSFKCMLCVFFNVCVCVYE